MVKQEKFITKTAEETKQLAQEFISKRLLVQGDSLTQRTGAIVIALYGDLGSGKTTFVQGIARGLGITHRIISPTFIIVRTYEIRGKGKAERVKSFYHFDLYRLESERDIEGLGLQEILNDPDAIVAIEWAERLPFLPDNRTDIRFVDLSDTERKIIFNEQ